MLKKRYIFSFLLFVFQLNTWVHANTESEQLYSSSVKLFSNSKYEDSIEKLLHAIEKEPNIARYHHLLAKSYGREAENSGWLKAIRYAKRRVFIFNNSFSVYANSLICAKAAHMFFQVLLMEAGILY